MQRAHFFRRAANVQNAVVGRRAERVLMRKLEYPAGEKVAGLYEAIPEVSSPGHVRFAARHGCRKGIKLFELRFQPEEFAFDFSGIVSGAKHTLFKFLQSIILNRVEIR